MSQGRHARTSPAVPATGLTLVVYRVQRAAPHLHKRRGDAGIALGFTTIGMRWIHNRMAERQDLQRTCGRDLVVLDLVLLGTPALRGCAERLTGM